jgi:single-stranded-DNA-specific exonuclease
MAFKLAHALWLSFLGDQDPERLDYFLFSHLDLVSLGILADRMPLRGENRILVWHGLRRLAYSRKAGLSSLTRFFRVTPRTAPVTVREATWQLIPILNAAGRLGRPDITTELLLSEDPDAARECIDHMLKLNAQRRAAQDESLATFEKAILEQCSLERDAVLIALAQGLEPSVTGLAAQAVVRKYGKPVFLFVTQGDHCIGSGRGLPGVDLFAWIETHQEWLVKFGGHQGAVGLTVRRTDFAPFCRGLMKTARETLASIDPALLASDPSEVGLKPESRVTLKDLDEYWWMSLERLGPFGAGHPMPLFEIVEVASIMPVKKKRSKNPPQEFILKQDGREITARLDMDAASPDAKCIIESMGCEEIPGPWTVIGYPVRAKASSGRKMDWIIRDLNRRIVNDG